jgi:hypothetical protein
VCLNSSKNENLSKQTTCTDNLSLQIKQQTPHITYFYGIHLNLPYPLQSSKRLPQNPIHAGLPIWAGCPVKQNFSIYHTRKIYGGGERHLYVFLTMESTKVVSFMF